MNIPTFPPDDLYLPPLKPLPEPESLPEFVVKLLQQIHTNITPFIPKSPSIKSTNIFNIQSKNFTLLNVLVVHEPVINKTKDVIIYVINGKVKYILIEFNVQIQIKFNRKTKYIRTKNPKASSLNYSCFTAICDNYHNPNPAGWIRRGKFCINPNNLCYPVYYKIYNIKNLITSKQSDVVIPFEIHLCVDIK